MNRLTSTLMADIGANDGHNPRLQLQRGDRLFQQGDRADWVFLVEEGLVKLTRLLEGSGSVILTIVGPGQLLGDDALSARESSYFGMAELLSRGVVQRIPREEMLRLVNTQESIRSELLNMLIAREKEMARKIELLCLQDVEHRILYYLAELANLMPQALDSGDHNIPLTQLELAELVGATRETTSTTLNQLERRGLVKLSRRMMTVASPQRLNELAMKPPGVDHHVASHT